MKKPIFILSILSIIIFTSVATKPESEKITICHVPPGNPENAHSIEISTEALETHLSHGDSIGACMTFTPPIVIITPETEEPKSPTTTSGDPIEH